LATISAAGTAVATLLLAFDRQAAADYEQESIKRERLGRGK